VGRWSEGQNAAPSPRSATLRRVSRFFSGQRPAAQQPGSSDMSSSTPPFQRLLPPATLASLANLELVARTAVEGFLTGLHRSPRFGFSQEFKEYRAYTEGDDPRFVDWNVYARTERTYIRRY